MKKSIVIAISTALLACAAFSVQAAGNKLDQIKSDGVITLGHRSASIPLSYINNEQQPIGYTVDICKDLVKRLSAELHTPLKTKWVAVTGATRIPLIANGTIDLSCGSATNTKKRQAQVAFAPTTFITGNRYLYAKGSGLGTLASLKGKNIVSVAGTNNIRQVYKINNEKHLGMHIISESNQAEAMLMLTKGRADAFFEDGIQLAALAAESENPSRWVMAKHRFAFEAAAIIEPKNEPAFKKTVDGIIEGMMSDGTMQKLYKKWFESPIPTHGINLKLPMSKELEHAFKHPTDSPYEKDYK